ncbi:MAG TPA: cytochrome c oxidase accessory protein CcoG [Kofleriaceae bacterium]|nr:cytochrome c oxidase accessory protein CcoG [Kofleriaceae bacterium]
MSAPTSIAQAPGPVLSTLEADGSRRKLHPRVSPGRFHAGRRWVGYALIALFVGLPYVELGGKPAILLDLLRREFTFFGATFRPADGAILMLLGLTIALAVFLVTALFGRVWCGWGCPQTVYLEWVFRPIERLFEGGPAGSRRLDARGGWSWRRAAKWAVYLALAFALAHTFLSYFVGASTVATWVRSSPAAHPVGFGVVVAVTALMFADFAWFREQTCIVACPYGRLQSVLLDRNSLIVGYDHGRGEPRGKAPRGRRARALVVVPDETPKVGDCVDCRACVATCPTGIDIRDGLQMECIGCAQCIDACDAIMDRLDRPRGLIRYTSETELAGGKRRIWRARTLIYPAALALVAVLFVGQVRARTEADVWVLRPDGAPFALLDDGAVSTPVRIKIENRTGAARTYTVRVDGVPGARVIDPRGSYPVAPGASTIVPLFVISPPAAFVHGRHAAQVVVADDGGWHTTLAVTLLGPEAAP